MADTMKIDVHTSLGEERYWSFDFPLTARKCRVVKRLFNFLHRIHYSDKLSRSEREMGEELEYMVLEALFKSYGIKK